MEHTSDQGAGVKEFRRWKDNDMGSVYLGEPE